MGTHDAVGPVVLRVLVVVLLLANLGFHAWTRGWLGPLHDEREPERLARQVRPELIRILPTAGANLSPAGLASAGPASNPGTISLPLAEPAPPSAALIGAGPVTLCLQAGPFTPSEVGKVEAALRAALPELGAASVNNLKVETPGIWLIYMGRFADREALQQRKNELRRVRDLAFEEVHGAPDLEPGIMFGRHADRAAADAELAALSERGVRNARVVALSPPVAVHTLRIARVNDALKAQLLALPPATLAGTTFHSCPPA